MFFNAAAVSAGTVFGRYHYALDAITELPAEGWTSRGGRTLSAVGRARLADLAMTLRSLRAHSYLSVPELVGEAWACRAPARLVAAQRSSSRSCS